ncbi:hypothetical protein NW456_004600 [Salmonella enterica]|nr:hypothetical protein [Escherichia coli]EFB2554469.1 hypothetical protein [Escherichia coli]EJS2083580.1 hypothetical protein [Salmonella enterica]EKE8204874.1 hypothetical protein [Salmonella enterica]
MKRIVFSILLLLSFHANAYYLSCEQVGKIAVAVTTSSNEKATQNDTKYGDIQKNNLSKIENHAVLFCQEVRKFKVTPETADSWAEYTSLKAELDSEMKNNIKIITRLSVIQ